MRAITIDMGSDIANKDMKRNLKNRSGYLWTLENKLLRNEFNCDIRLDTIAGVVVVSVSTTTLIYGYITPIRKQKSVVYFPTNMLPSRIIDAIDTTTQNLLDDLFGYS